jgi:hypothetical protein
MSNAVTRRGAMGLVAAGWLAPRRDALAQPAPEAAPAEAPAAQAPTEAAPASRRGATLAISQTQASLLGSVAWGAGTLTYRGRVHRFRLRGIGVGGIGITHMTASGEVFGMTRLSDFPGLYGQARAGAVAGAMQVQGGIWLQNPAGVRIHLWPRRTGVALQVGADGILVEMR